MVGREGLVVKEFVYDRFADPIDRSVALFIIVDWHIVVFERCDVVVGYGASVFDEKDFEMAFHLEDCGFHQGSPKVFGEARHEVQIGCCSSKLRGGLVCSSRVYYHRVDVTRIATFIDFYTKVSSGGLPLV